MSKGPPPQRLFPPRALWFPDTRCPRASLAHPDRTVTLRQVLGNGVYVSTDGAPPSQDLLKGDWTAEDDDLLRSQYPLGKKAAIAAISAIQAWHPGLTRREIAKRARALGLRCTGEVQRRDWDRGTDLVLILVAGSSAQGDHRQTPWAIRGIHRGAVAPAGEVGRLLWWLQGQGLGWRT